MHSAIVMLESLITTIRNHLINHALTTTSQANQIAVSRPIPLSSTELLCQLRAVEHVFGTACDVGSPVEPQHHCTWAQMGGPTCIGNYRCVYRQVYSL